MRLFIALELESNVRERLKEIQAALRREVDPRWVRWVQPDGIHLTLKFLGEVDAGKAADLELALARQVPHHVPCRFQVAEVGAFPNPDRARVLWIGLRDEGRSIAALQAGIEDALEDVGFPRERRPFAPHLTLGRVREGIGGEAQANLGRVLRAFPGLEPVDTGADQVRLVRSELRPEGAVHTVLGVFSLGEERR
jgi:2'-5' RNA ligase